MDIVANAKKVRLEAAALLSEAQARGAGQPQVTGQSYTRVGSILVPTAATAAQASEGNKALEEAAVKLAEAHAKLMPYATKGAMSLESIAVDAEARACLAGLAAITSYLSSANVAAGAAAALEGTFHKTPGGLWVPGKAS